MRISPVNNTYNFGRGCIQMGTTIRPIDTIAKITPWSDGDGSTITFSDGVTTNFQGESPAATFSLLFKEIDKNNAKVIIYSDGSWIPCTGIIY